MYKILAFLCFANYASGQQHEIKPSLDVSGFVDIFYAYDFNQPLNSQRLPFLFNHNRHNEFNLNLGVLKIDLNHDKYRAKLALQAGTYPNDNYSSEPGVLKNIYEASAGISLHKNGNLWLDAGIMPSHIGFETAWSIDNPTLTRSLIAENSPYYLTGVKLTGLIQKKWEVAALICNGWQRIAKVKENSFLSFGSQVKFMPANGWVINWSSFSGTDDPDSTRRIRYFNNFYIQFPLSNKVEITGGFDIGFQQKNKEASDFVTWFGFSSILRFKLSDKLATAARAEYYQDDKNVITSIENIGGFKTSGFSVNMDYSPAQTIACRIEGKLYASPDLLFPVKEGYSKTNFSLTTSIAMKLESFKK